MKLDQNMLDELNVLLQFDLTNTQQGIKIHHEAKPDAISAAARLFEKGLIDQKDGGYLTNMGRIACEHAQPLYGLLMKTE
ncbi:MAG: DNA-binding protein [Cycloclasticus sp. symbiont of Poecilosclerida sp. M]|nr:MAG: DNA-binding protein [Cycloclasticus sp. symbiont of Poecilosclerida sp. M]